MSKPLVREWLRDSTPACGIEQLHVHRLRRGAVLQQVPRRGDARKAAANDRVPAPPWRQEICSYQMHASVLSASRAGRPCMVDVHLGRCTVAALPIALMHAIHLLARCCAENSPQRPHARCDAKPQPGRRDTLPT